MGRISASDLKIVRDSMRDLLAMFQPERYLFLAASAAGIILAVYVTWSQLDGNPMPQAEAILLFGSSSLVAGAAIRTTYWFGRAFALIEKLVMLALAGEGSDAS